MNLHPRNPQHNNQGRKGPCCFQRLNVLKGLKCQKIPNPPPGSYLLDQTGEKTLSGHTIFLAILHQGGKRAIFMTQNILAKDLVSELVPVIWKQEFSKILNVR